MYSYFPYYQYLTILLNHLQVLEAHHIGITALCCFSQCALRQPIYLGYLTQQKVLIIIGSTEYGCCVTTQVHRGAKQREWHWFKPTFITFVLPQHKSVNGPY